VSQVRVNPNVYQAVTQAAQDGRFTPQEMQDIRIEMEASSGISANEQRALDALESRTQLTLTDGQSQTPIEPNQMQFPSPAMPLTGAPIGEDTSHHRLRLGTLHGTYLSEREALQSARRIWGIIDSPDLAIMQTREGNYQVYGVEGGGHNGGDFGNYEQTRAAALTAVLPDGSRLTGLMSDNHATRFLNREATPNRYGRPADPQPLTDAATTSIPVRLQRVADLRAQATQTVARLQHMERDLGPQKDHRGIFSAMYRVITERGVRDMDRLAEQGDLRGAEMTGSLITNFANRYFDAYDAYSRGDMANVPEVWRSAFDSGRNAEAAGYPAASVTEVVSLSMVAHIINDLPQTLQDIGYPTASDRASHLEGVYDSFNQALMEEKPNILAALTQHYGVTDMHLLDTLGAGFFGARPFLPPNLRQGSQTANVLQGEVFTQMRTFARESAVARTPEQIRIQGLNISDWVRTLTPGGN
jgi:hypothetical protein